jgi:lipoate-protein ligase A
MFHLLHLKNCPIFQQLQIEEALLRADTRNFCIINEGSTPAIVLGISGKVDELVDQEKAALQNIPLIRRFSGGGTVLVDESTLFVTFICQRDLHDFAPFPEPIMKWSEGLYKEVFSHELFSLRENDYALGEKKFGGNAQYLKKDRWLHHTSFLWDYCPEKMGCLLHPKKTPSYRDGRMHEEFLCRMKEFFSSSEEVVAKLKSTLSDRYGTVEIELEDLQDRLALPYRKATQFLCAEQTP